ncbi:MAG: TIGR02452 family protein [Myxococcales bacterium]|nr:TIGR02452 family protein [Myxococcales bacterium]
MSLKQSARDVLALLERGTWTTEHGEADIREIQAAAVAGSRLYTPSTLEALREHAQPGLPAAEVTDATTQVAAKALGRAFVLNFASARNPGGGFLNGAKAQEEDLCRCSGLYPTLLEHPDYYRANRDQPSLIYTDHAIHSPGVPFFRTSSRDAPGPVFLADVLTMPAPNSAPHLARNPGDHATLEAAFHRRWRNVLAIASDVGARTLLLGAWGCGAFGGDPEVASRTARRALEEAGGPFERVVFAIPGSGRRSRANLEVFARVLAV